MKSKIEIRDNVVTAFKKSSYKWRTVRGLSKDSKVPIFDVEEFLDNSDLVIRSRKPNSKGHPLFALKEVYEAKTPFGTKLINAIVNKISE